MFGGVISEYPGGANGKGSTYRTIPINFDQQIPRFSTIPEILSYPQVIGPPGDMDKYLGGGFKYFLFSPRTLGK